MDVVQYNRTLLNKMRIYNLNTKTMVFIIPRIIQQGLVRTEVRFPYEGKIVDVYATCGVTGSTDTILDVEKCSQEDYDNSPQWSSVFRNKLVIDAGHKSSNSSSSPYLLNETTSLVYPNDHFRVNVVEAGEGVEDITLEVVVELEVEPK